MLFMQILTFVDVCMYDYICSLKMKTSFSNSLTFAMPAAAAKLLRLCLTLCDHMDCSPPGSSDRGILQERTLQWIAMLCLLQ